MPKNIGMIMAFVAVIFCIRIVIVLLRGYSLNKKLQNVGTETEKTAVAGVQQNRSAAQRPARTDPVLVKKINKKLQKAKKRADATRKIWPYIVLGILLVVATFSGCKVFFFAVILFTACGVVPYLILSALGRQISYARLRKKFYREYLPVLLSQELCDYRPEIGPVGRDLKVEGSMQLQSEQYRVAVQFSLFPFCHKAYQKHEESYYTIEQEVKMQIIPAENPIRQGTLQLWEDAGEMPGGFAMLPVRMMMKGIEGVGRLADAVTGREDNTVLLEDPEFEKYFDVRADDQIESRMFLTPVQMQTLCSFHKKVGRFSAGYTKEGITVHFRDMKMIGTGGCRDTGVPGELYFLGHRELENALQLLPMLWKEDAGCRN